MGGRTPSGGGGVKRGAGATIVEISAKLLYMFSKEFTMLALRLPPEIEKRLNSLAKKTGRTKSFYAREAILRHIEDIEDFHLASKRLKRGGKRVSLETLEKDLL
jgi:RHH-type rel operon transcriptional repressor/antitoxin RelB